MSTIPGAAARRAASAVALRFRHRASSSACVDPAVADSIRARHRTRSHEAEELRASEERISRLRLATVLAGFATFWIGYDTGLFAPALALAFAVGFALLVVRHDRTTRRRRRAERAAHFHEGSVQRLEDRWAGSGAGGDEFRDPAHPYGEDLDLFGRGSLFELLNRARTRAGERRLAEWLLHAAAPAAIDARQEAVRELAPRLDLREDMAVIGEDLGAGLEPEALVAWAEAPGRLDAAWARGAAPALVAAAVAAAAAWATGASGPGPFVLALAAEALLGLVLRRRVHRILHEVQRPTRDLRLLAEALGRLERETFVAPRLVALRRSLDVAGEPASVRIDRLRRRVDLLDARRNELFAPLAAMLLWGTQCALAIESWRRTSGASVAVWIDAVAEFEALLSLAAFACEHPDFVFPELDAPAPTFAATGLGHPLLPRQGCVTNDVRLDAGRRVLLVSGSNMSGKSTLLRAVGLAAVLAQAGAPVRCTRLHLSPLALGASLRIVDSLQTGTSHFYAEVKRLRQIVDLTAGGAPLLFLLDEVLHGTNSHDRRIGAEAVVRGLVQRGAIGLVTTHDLALAAIADDPAVAAENVHFEDQLTDGRMSFDYRMQPGVVRRSNALELMRSVGLDV